MQDNRDHARVFFALLPDALTADAIEYHAGQFSPQTGKKVTPDNYHITLLFLGNVENKTIDALCMECENLAHADFDITISRAGWWPKPKILWLAPQQTPAALSELVNSLNTLAIGRNITGDNRNYFPHITLMRKVVHPPRYPRIKPFKWQARGFSLMQSITRPQGVQYREVAHWALVT